MKNTKTTGNSIQHIFKSLLHFQRSGRRKFCFSLQMKGSFHVMYCQEMKMFGLENIQTVQLLLLHLQHQSVLEEGQTICSHQLTAEHATVMYLPVAIKGCHHKLHMKIFFYSPQLYDDLTKKRIYC